MAHIRGYVKGRNWAAEALAGMGLTVSGAVRIPLTRIVAEKSFSFDLRPFHAAGMQAANRTPPIA
jgi:antitoxin component of RelBE/YafQ-DinJ toxin-antitoxin module